MAYSGRHHVRGDVMTRASGGVYRSCGILVTLRFSFSFLVYIALPRLALLLRQGMAYNAHIL
jgi:hypothetical protein